MLWLGDADRPNVPTVLALAEAMLVAWPRARWDADCGFAALMPQRQRRLARPRGRGRR